MATFIVDAGGSGDFTTIQDAINAAAAGDTISILAGTYAGASIDKGLTIVGDGAVTIDSSGGNGLSIGATAGADVSIDNIDFTGNAVGVRMSSAADAANVFISNSDFTGNTVHGVGSGSGAPMVGNVEITASTFNGNGTGGTNGTGDIVLFYYLGDALIQNVTINGVAATEAQADRGDDAIQISGFVPSTYDVEEPIGTVVIDNVTVTGAYHKNQLKVQGYNDMDGITFTNVSLTGETNWGDLLFVSPIASSGTATPGTPGFPGAYIADPANLTTTMDFSGITINNDSMPKASALSTFFGGPFPIPVPGAWDGFDARTRGTEADDTITGTNGNDLLNDFADGGVDYGGDDTASGGDGEDLIFGGAGDDVLSGDAGDDTLIGGGDADTLDGGADDDLLSGLGGDDTLVGGEGYNILLGGAGSDTITGGSMTDIISDGDGDDGVLGIGGVPVTFGVMAGAGDDIIFAAQGNDAIDGGDGRDTFVLFPNNNGGGFVDLENDQAFGGTDTGIDAIVSIENVIGSDGVDQVQGANDEANTIFASGDDDILDGGTGAEADTYDASLAALNVTGSILSGVDFSQLENFDASSLGTLTEVGNLLANVGGLLSAPPAPGDFTIDFVGGTATNGTWTDTISNFENAIGGEGNDTFIGDGGANLLIGNGGDDSFTSGGGGDDVRGGDGTDTYMAEIASTDPSYSLSFNDTTGKWDFTAGDADELSGIEIVEFTDGVKIFLIGEDFDGTFQSIVDAASAGDTIMLSSGNIQPTDSATITIDKDLTIMGQGKLDTVFEASFSTGSSGDARGWFLVEDGVTLDVADMTFDGAGEDIWQAFRHKGSGTFDNVNFTDIQFEPSGPSYAGTAIAALGPTSDVDVTNSMFSDIGRIGVLYFGAGTTGTFENNMYTGKGAGDWLDYALDIGAGAVVDVTGNTVTDNLGVASVDGSVSAGFLVSTFFGPGTTANFTDNTVSNSSNGVFVGFDSLDTSSVNFLAGATGNDLSGATTGLAVVGDAVITGVNDNTTGVVDWDGGAAANLIEGGDEGDELDGGFGGDTINGNGGADDIDGGNNGDTISGGADGDTIDGKGGADDIMGDGGDDIILGGGASDMLDGGDGEDDLSGQAQDDTLIGGLMDDTLDGGADIDTAEFADNFADVSFAEGSLEVTTMTEGVDTLTNVEILEFGDGTTVRVVGAGSEYATIQDAVDDADAGDTILVMPGTYDESTTIDKPLTILGFGVGSTIITSTAGGSSAFEFDTTGFAGTEVVRFDGIEIMDPSRSGVRLDSADTLGKLEFVNGKISGAGTNGIEINDAALADALVMDSTFENNGNGTSGGDGSLSFFQYEGDATLKGLTLTGDWDGTTGPRTEIQFRDDTGSLGTVLIEDVTIDGAFRNQAIGIFNYDDISGLTMTDVTVNADSEFFNTTINFDGISGDIDLTNETGPGAKFVNVTSPNLVVNGDVVSVQGDDGMNTLTSDDENSFIRGRGGDDTLQGGAGDDLIVGDDLAPTASDGNDTASGGDGDDDILGGGGMDTLMGDAGEDLLSGDDGDDDLDGGADNDTLDGGGDNDTLIGGEGDDDLIGGTGIDTAVYADASTNYTVDAIAGTITDDEPTVDDGTDTFTGVEILDFTDKDILIVGPGSDFADLQDAIDAASDGDTILVLPGTVLADSDGEAVITTPNLTIMGDVGSIIDGRIRIEADGTTIKDVAFEDYSGSTNAKIINVVGATDAPIMNTTIMGVSFTLDAASPAFQSGTEIEAKNADGLTITGVTVDRTGYTGQTDKAGIRLIDTTNTSVTGNTLTEARIGVSGDAPYSGSVPATVIVTGNTITSPAGIDDAIFAFSMTDILGLDISGNTIAAPAGVQVQGTDNADDLSVYTTDGNDLFIGKDGSDILVGGLGDDNLQGGDDNDTIDGGEGDDDLDGGNGDDTFNYAVGDGADTIDGGGSGTDTDTLNIDGSAAAGPVSYDISEGAGEVEIDIDGTVSTATDLEDIAITTSGFGDTVTLGGDLPSVGVSVSTVSVTGGAGNDTLDASGLTAAVGVVANLGAGDDTFVAGLGDHTIDGGAMEVDLYDAGGVTSNTVINLTVGFAAGAGIGVDQISNFDNVRGGSAVDQITGGAFGNTIFASAGNDIIDGAAGKNFYDASDQTTGVLIDLDGGTAIGAVIGSDSLTNIGNAKGGSANDILVGDAGNNELFGNAGMDNLTGNDGDDRLFGGLDDDELNGGVGEDFLQGNEGDDVIYGGDDDDTLIGAQDDDDLYGEAGNDKVFAGIGNDDIFGGAGDDEIKAGEGDDFVDGGDDIDTFILSGDFDQYIVDFLAGTVEDINATDTGGDEGTDTFVDVEFLQFQDQTIDLNNLPPETGRDDLDGSGFSDIVFQEAATSHFVGVSGGDGALVRNYLQVPNTVIGIEDIDGDDAEDLVFTNNTTNGHFWVNSADGTINPFGLATFDVLAARDLDADGQVEFLARQTGGANAYNIFDAAGAPESALGYGPHQLVGIGELDNSNVGEELLFVNGTSGGLFSVSATTGLRLDPFILNTANLDFQGLADIDGDGTDEIIVERVSTTSKEAFDASGNLVSNFGRVGEDLKAIGDFNGDGIDDLVFQRTGAFDDFVVTSGDKSFFNTIGTGTTDTIVGVGNYDGSQDLSDDLLFLNGAGEHVSADAITDAEIVNYGRVGDTAIVNDIFNTGVDLIDTDPLIG